MSNEMIDRIAQTLCENNGYQGDPFGSALGFGFPWAEQSDRNKDHYRFIAAAVLKSMLEPTESMYDAVSATGKMWRETNSTEIYKTMIGAALRDEADTAMP